MTQKASCQGPRRAHVGRKPRQRAATPSVRTDLTRQSSDPRYIGLAGSWLITRVLMTSAGVDTRLATNPEHTEASRCAGRPSDTSPERRMAPLAES